MALPRSVQDISDEATRLTDTDLIELWRFAHFLAKGRQSLTVDIYRAEMNKRGLVFPDSWKGKNEP
jgi:hypothetical protein